MKTSIKFLIFTFIFLLVSIPVFSQYSKKELNGWFKAGSMPQCYSIGLENDVKYKGETTYFLRSDSLGIAGFGTIMKNVKPFQYIGKRIRLSCMIKSDNIDAWAGMWMRVDATTPGIMNQFDNMLNRPIVGSSDWTKYEIVLDVTDNSAMIFYGVLLTGTGSIRLTEPVLEVVGNEVESTNIPTKQPTVTTNYSELPDEIANIPEGIEVKHNVSSLAAKIGDKDTMMYYWNYETSVKPIKEDIEITEYGCYTWLVDHWVFSNISRTPYTNANFADDYRCTNGKMKKGKTYTDLNNFTRWSELQNVISLWYFVGKNKDGKLFKGTAIIDCLPAVGY